MGEIELARATLDEAHRTFVENLRGVSLDEALDPAGGYRSILGIAKHAAAWSAVYYSYAFEPTPRHWDATDWPRGLRDRIEARAAYLGEVLAWFDRTYERWLASLASVDDLDAPKPVHWGGTAPLSEIVAMVAAHWAYHAGEINAILAIRRGQAWEYGEEVEENHIATVGHRVRPAWMTDEQAAAFEPQGRGRLEDDDHSSGPLGHIGATSGPRTTGSRRTTAVTTNSPSAQLSRHTPPPTAGRRDPSGLSDTEGVTGSNPVAPSIKPLTSGNGGQFAV